MKIVFRHNGDVELDRGPDADWVKWFGWVLSAAFIGWSAAKAYYWHLWLY